MAACISQIDKQEYTASAQSRGREGTGQLVSINSDVCGFDTCLSIHHSVCPHLGEGTWPGPRGGGVLLGGTPSGGYPTSDTPLSDLAWGYPCGRVPHLRYPRPGLTEGTPAGRGTSPQVSPIRPGWGGGYSTSCNRWSTCYATVGMPLAFTQEDFLV